MPRSSSTSALPPCTCAIADKCEIENEELKIEKTLAISIFNSSFSIRNSSTNVLISAQCNLSVNYIIEFRDTTCYNFLYGGMVVGFSFAVIRSAPAKSAMFDQDTWRRQI